MSEANEISFIVDFGGRRRGEPHKSSRPKAAPPPIPRIARLMALAIRFDGLIRERTIRNRAELARLGHVTRARVTQIMKLLYLAPDLQEQLLFLTIKQLNERNLRPLVKCVGWDEQRRMFATLMGDHNPTSDPK